jgi:flavin reductase (DIM6/NTAB) family NADH-FMN oxidoreductase RutF
MPCAIVAVRPSRFTYEFMEKYPDFTLCAFPSAYHKALTLLGTVSGRDGDKIAESGLTPEPAAFVAAPVFAEAELAVECRRLYWEDLQPDKLTDPRARLSYPKPDYHRLYLGEMLAVTGTSAYHT